MGNKNVKPESDTFIYGNDIFSMHRDYKNNPNKYILIAEVDKDKKRVFLYHQVGARLITIFAYSKKALMCYIIGAGDFFRTAGSDPNSDAHKKVLEDFITETYMEAMNARPDDDTKKVMNSAKVWLPRDRN